MSTAIMAACWPLSGMSPTQKAVLISLADNANDQGMCWPSIATIGKRTCLSERAVQNAIKWLEQSGLVMTNRSNGRHTNYTVTPAAYRETTLRDPLALTLSVDKSTRAADAPACTLSQANVAAAGGLRTRCTAPPQQMPTNRKEPSEEPLQESAPTDRSARRRPSVALHEELLNFDLPAWLPFDVWDMWCEHREAKAAQKRVPWTRPAAVTAIRKLDALRQAGHSVRVVVEEAVLRGWTGLFEIRTTPASTQATAASAAGSEWWKSASGIVKRGRELGLEQGPDEIFLRFRTRVVKQSGPGPWADEMLAQAARESMQRYEALYVYLNGSSIARSQHTHAAPAVPIREAPS